MKEFGVTERYREARHHGIGRMLSSFVAMRSAELSFVKVDASMETYALCRNAGLVENLDPANILVPGI